MDAHALFGGPAVGDDRSTMDPEHARLMAAHLHGDELEEDGTPLLAHVRRVAAMVPAEARAVAWLHEALESTTVAEEDLLLAGLTSEQLRALRLLNLNNLSQSELAYLAHLELIARSAGESGRLARIVKLADLRDRCAHPRLRRSGWSPPYAQGLQLLTGTTDGHAGLAAEVG
jgi:hypothetical protein